MTQLMRVTDSHHLRPAPHSRETIQICILPPIVRSGYSLELGIHVALTH